MKQTVSDRNTAANDSKVVVAGETEFQFEIHTKYDKSTETLSYQVIILHDGKPFHVADRDVKVAEEYRERSKVRLGPNILDDPDSLLRLATKLIESSDDKCVKLQDLKYAAKVQTKNYGDFKRLLAELVAQGYLVQFQKRKPEIGRAHV